jgi:hypothetical protein
MNKKEIKYLQFPLSMLPEIVFNTQATIKKIVYYGIYHYSKIILEKKEVDIEKALKQFLYFFYRKKEFLTDRLIQKMERYISEETLILDMEYNGFRNETFNPESEINSLMVIIQMDSDFKFEILELYWIYSSSCFFNFEKRINPKQILKIGSQVYSEIKPKEPLVSCKLDHLEDYYKNEKDENEKIQLVSFLAIKSILGAKKPWVKTNKNHIVCRMIGYSSVKELPNKFSENEYKLFNTYSHRYHIDKLISKLELNWRIVVYGKNMKGICIGLKDSITLEKLVFEAEKNREKNRIIDLKNLKRDAELKALNQLKNLNSNLTDDKNLF